MIKLTIFGDQLAGDSTAKALEMHHQNSSSVSLVHANTEMLFCAKAAATSFCVEKMLHATHLTSAPSRINVSISTPVWAVM